MVRLIITYIAITALLFSCDTSIQPNQTCDMVNANGEGIFVLCEGLYGYNNATLWFSDMTNSEDVFSCANNGRKLGDTANDLLKINDSTFAIIVSSSNEVFVCNRKGKIIRAGYIPESGHFLKKGALFNDSILFISDLYADLIWKVNLISMKFDTLINNTLCAPDGIEIHENILAICNSGYGVFRYKEPYAGTVLFYDLNTKKSIVKTIGPNVQNITYSPKTQSWLAQYSHLTTQKDSIGGLVELSALNYQVKSFQRGKYSSKVILAQDQSALYAIVDNSLYRRSIENDVFSEKIDLILRNETIDSWYRVFLLKNSLCIFNAGNFMVNGNIMIVDPEKKILSSRISVGLNPNTLISM